MLSSRIIPCLLIHKSGLYKTVNFKDPKYVGDPINAVRIFNEKNVDELVVLDIDATKKGLLPNYDLISVLSAECRMPICYGGGIKNSEQVEKIINLGVEKVAIGSSAISDPELISKSSRKVGSQSIVAVMDVKKTGLLNSKYEVYTHNGTKNSGMEAKSFAKELEKLGAGEIILNSINQDGTMKGFDHELIKLVYSSINIPMTALGGAGNFRDLALLIKEFPYLGVAAGSLFVFKGKYRAVLIQYPDDAKKNEILSGVNIS